MKAIILTAIFLVAGYTIVAAQCDKKLNLKIERTYQLQPDSSEGETIPATTTITLTKDSIHIVVQLTDGNTMDLKGLSKETVCKMNTDYSEGTIELVYDAVLLVKGSTKSEKMFFTIISKKGAMKLIGAPESNMSDKLCFIVQSKEEIK